MTTTSTHDTGPALPEIPPMSAATMAVGLTDLLDEASDLPQPCFIAIYDTQAISVQLDPQQAGVHAVTRWALRFGGVLVSRPGQNENGRPVTYHYAEFSYCDIAVTAYTTIPDTPSGT